MIRYLKFKDSCSYLTIINDNNLLFQRKPFRINEESTAQEILDDINNQKEVN